MIALVRNSEQKRLHLANVPSSRPFRSSDVVSNSVDLLITYRALESILILPLEISEMTKGFVIAYCLSAAGTFVPLPQSHQLLL